MPSAKTNRIRRKKSNTFKRIKSVVSLPTRCLILLTAPPVPQPAVLSYQTKPKIEMKFHLERIIFYTCVTDSV